MDQTAQLAAAAKYRDQPLKYNQPEDKPERVAKIKVQSPNGYEGTAIVYRDKDGSLYADAQLGSISHTRHRVRYLPVSEHQPETEDEQVGLTTV